MLDLGCGNGYTDVAGTRLEGWTFTGVDFAHSLITGAMTLLVSEPGPLRSLLEFVHADAMDILKGRPAVDGLRVDRAIPAELCLDAGAGRDDPGHSPGAGSGGRLLMCEGSADGFEGLNDLRDAVGLERIPATCRENVSAVRFDDAEVETRLDGLGFDLIAKEGFSTYFMLTRVLHPLLVAPSAPRFDARINDESRRLQLHTPFAPGYGGSVLWVCEKRQPSA